MKKTNETQIQAKMFDFALSELVRRQRNSFAPLWTLDSWVKFLIWLSLNCGMSGERESLATFAEALGSAVTIRMRKNFFERNIESDSLYLLADPSDEKVFVMPLGENASLTHESCIKAFEHVGLTERVITDVSKWESFDQLIAIPWKSSETGC
ncbi:protein phosphatase [Prochlorococcus marinus]|uniref:protein phosphatase n=1 Tax=Prochlorococcus marinus TaxID=1219 RepID=UPI0022B3C639|nr:protein phosphatase [Prochlorococcus marinus]